ncbi:MAG: hypothetical protein AAB385_05020 [Planctomycetota bacterium]
MEGPVKGDILVVLVPFTDLSAVERSTIMTTETTKTQDEAQIRQLIADQARAISAKDPDRIMAHYAADAIIFRFN